MELNVKKQYLVFDVIKATTRDNRPYLRMVFYDDNGTNFNAIMFDSNKLAFEPKKGDMVDVMAVLQHHNNQPQLKVFEMSYLGNTGADAFLPKSKFDAEQMSVELKHLFTKNLSNEWLVKLVITFFNDKPVWEKFCVMPAAKSMHHAYINGLLEHTLNIVRVAVDISRFYPNVDRNMVMVGALFHDIGKVFELTKDSGFEYTTDGRLLGHLLQGYTLIDGYIATIEGFPERLRTEVLHMIASHHGSLEYGSPQLPKTLEALMLSFIDDMDAKINAVEQIFNKENVPTGEWSSYDRLLERQFYKTR